MIFNIVYGKKPTYTVTLYGYPSNTILVDGTTTVSLDADGFGTVVLDRGSHTFVDGFVAGNEKTFNISSNAVIVVGLFVGSISQFASNAEHHDYAATSYGSRSNSKAIPDGNVAPLSNVKVSGSVRARQTISGYATGPTCSAYGKITVDGVKIAEATSAALTYGDFSTERYTDWQSISGTETITEKTSGTISFTMDTSVTTQSASMNSYSYADGKADYIYVY